MHNFIQLFFKYRRLLNLFERGLKIFIRYGFTEKQIKECLDKFVRLMHGYNCTPSFPITACVLKRNSALIQSYVAKGVDFAVHGYTHLDYTTLSLKTLIEHFEKAISIFKKLNIPFNGFRWPYLKWNEQIREVLNSFDFLWDSSQVVIWDFFKSDATSPEKWKNYQKMLEQYRPADAQNCVLRPKFKYNFVEIPVSLPDDDILIDRLGITDNEMIEKIWGKILKQTHKHGELFTLQLHPERIHLCEKALKAILEKARNLNPPIWIASLSEIARWWKEKRDFNFEIKKQSGNIYQIKMNCSKRATILVKKSDANESKQDFFDGYEIKNSNSFFIESDARPIVGISTNSSKSFIDFIKEEGFAFELSDNKDDYGIYFCKYPNFTEEDEKEVLNTINHSSSSLVRLWRWPEKAQSALAVTGDIDAITSIDFIKRAFGR